MLNKAKSASGGEKSFPYLYPDPTKPIIPPIHHKINISWIIFIGVNLFIPIAFLAAYLWFTK